MPSLPSKKSAQDLIEKITKALASLQEIENQGAAAHGAAERHQAKIDELSSLPFSEASLETIALSQGKLKALAPLIEAAEERLEGPKEEFVILLKNAAEVCGMILGGACEERLEKITDAFAPFFRNREQALDAARHTDEFRAAFASGCAFTQAQFYRETSLETLRSLATKAVQVLKESISPKPDFTKFCQFKAPAETTSVE